MRSCSSIIKPCNPSVSRPLPHDPLENLLQDGLTRVFVAPRRVEALLGVMECRRGDVEIRTSWYRISHELINILILIIIFTPSMACESTTVNHSMFCIAKNSSRLALTSTGFPRLISAHRYHDRGEQRWV